MSEDLTLRQSIAEELVQKFPNTVYADRVIEKYGIEADSIVSGKNKDTGSFFRGLTKDEKAINVITSDINHFWTAFDSISNDESKDSHLFAKKILSYKNTTKHCFIFFICKHI